MTIWRQLSRIERLALLAVLALAAVLRLGWTGVNSFAFDEARLSLIALRMARGGEFASLGMPSSVGLPNLPGAAWIFALPYALSTDPLFATLFVGVLGVLTVFSVWLLARRVWGAWAALAAALYLAASPFAVLYARNIWAQDLLPPLALVWMWMAYEALTGEGRRRAVALAVHVFLAGFAFQVHFAGAALAIGTAYLFVRFGWWRLSRLIPVLIGGGLVLLALLPFVTTVTCCAPQIAEQFSSVLDGPSETNLDALSEGARLAVGWQWDYLLAGDTALSIPLLDHPIWAILIGAVIVVGLMVLVNIIRRGASRSAPTVLAELALVLLIAPLVLFVRHSSPVLLHYELTVLPALALVVGASTHLFQQRTWALAITSLVALVALVWAALLADSFNAAARVETPNGLGTPLQVSRDAAYALPNDTPVLFFTHGDDPNVDGEAGAFAALWWGREHRIVQGENILILPSYPAYLMATLRPFQAWEEIEVSGLANDVLEFPRREGALPFVATLYDGSEPQGFTAFEPVLLADGAQLEGWRARIVGPRLRISTLWLVVAAPPAGTYQQFHHLYTSDTLGGEPFMQSDVALSAGRWQAGDRVIVMGDFFVDAETLASADFYVDVGHYTLPDVVRVGRSDGSDGVIRLGPFRLDSDGDVIEHESP
ncbi:MAG: glycosyltransferase family 39 protein [Burkholderiales bacterium]|nr:glycosyltransferase family 39 protein [Anaerolineae bacterium]